MRSLETKTIPLFTPFPPARERRDLGNALVARALDLFDDARIFNHSKYNADLNKVEEKLKQLQNIVAELRK